MMLTPEQLAAVAKINFGDAMAQTTVRKLLAHIVAQQARIAELERQLLAANAARQEAQRMQQQVQEMMLRAGVAATKDAYLRGVAAEREAIANMCDDMEAVRNDPKWAIWTADGAVSAAIRARADSWPADFTMAAPKQGGV